jgi:hypothetical protein
MAVRKYAEVALERELSVWVVMVKCIAMGEEKPLSAEFAEASRRTRRVGSVCNLSG